MGSENDRRLRWDKGKICGWNAWILNESQPEKRKTSAFFDFTSKTVTRTRGARRNDPLIERTSFNFARLNSTKYTTKHLLSQKAIRKW